MVRSLAGILSVAVALSAGAQLAPGLPELAPPPAGLLSPAGSRLLQNLVVEGRDAELRWTDFSDLRAELGRFYGSRSWTLAWIREGRPTDAAWQLAVALAASARKGLEPLDYAADQLEPRLAAAETGSAPEPERVRLDVALTVSALRYARDLALGRIRPLPGTELLGRSQLARTAGPAPDLAAVVAEASAAVDPEGVFAAVEPDWPAYRRTVAELQRRLALPARAPLPPPAGGPVAPEAYEAPERLAERLRDEGFAVAPDGAADGACRSPLAEALADFQARRGLGPTGFVDEATARALNEPPARRVAQLTYALERWRWFGRRPPASWIVVNVPEFTLRAGEAEPVLSMRVVVGEAYEWGTPLLASELSQVVFRPAWSVPLQIQQEELVAHVEKDRRFIAAGDFEVVDEAERPMAPVATDELLAGLRSGGLRLRQRPGAANALGLVKFVLARSAWIYLHGTPSPELFGRSRRDFSHGCIRVEDPVALARWVLREERGWTPGAIRAAMAAPRTLELTLQRPPTVLITYFTATAWDDGGAGFYEDVYGQDAALAVALREEAERRAGALPDRGQPPVTPPPASPGAPAPAVPQPSPAPQAPAVPRLGYATPVPR